MELALGYVTAGIVFIACWLTAFFIGIYIDVLCPCKKHDHKHMVLENAAIATIVMWLTLIIMIYQFYFWHA
jgi:hypothetical protein